MCGISGFNFNNKELINRMNDSLSHRGPDYAGIYTDESVSLGHRRLSIIDISSTANQPMHYKHYSIVFNGEIYNFPEIKNDLEQLGHSFITQSDTEVILHSFEEWGVDCLNLFNGMWAFCVYDKIKQELFIARDRFGIKPLYYIFNNEQFIFASEIKAIYQHKINLSIDIKALNYYFYQKYVGDNRTIFNEIKKLTEAHYLIFNLKSKQLTIKKYYSVEAEIDKAKLLNLKDKEDKIRELIIDATHKRLIANVPVGSFLSGGIDSSLISSIVAKKNNTLNTFSIGFKEHTFNELDYSKLVAEKIKVQHNYKVMEIHEEFIFDIIKRLDEPFGDPSLIPTALLSEISKEKVTVAISGDAGDELFGGYDTYLAWKLAKFIPNILIKFLRKFIHLIPASDKNLHISFKIKKFIQDWHKDIEIRHLNWMSQTSNEQRKKLFNTNYIPMNNNIETNKKKDLINIQLNDFKNYMNNDILKKVDIASMISSLEVRIPFLDYRLVPLVLSLPNKLKIRLLTSKFLLKKIATKFIPKTIIKRKKAGFSVPLSLWFKQSENMQKIISDKKYYTHSLINYDYVNELLYDHINAKNDNSRILWLVFIFNIWYEQHNKQLQFNN